MFDEQQNNQSNLSSISEAEDILDVVDHEDANSNPVIRPQEPRPLGPVVASINQEFSPASGIPTANQVPIIPGAPLLPLGNRRGRGIVVFLVIIVLLLAIGVAAYYLYQVKFNSSLEPAAEEISLNEELPITSIPENSNQTVLENNNQNVVIENVNLNENVNLAPAVDPALVDSDKDGLTDEVEKTLGTNPNSLDSDNDGLYDRAEVKLYQTDPLKPDTDGDSYPDGEEVKNGYNPKGAGKLYEIPKE